MKKQRGLTLLEIIISLGILSTVVMGIVKLQDNVSEDTRASVNALHIKAVGQAAQEYIKDNYATLTGVASATNPALIRVSDLIAGGYLNSGFNVKNEKQQDTCVLVLEPTANKLMALVATEGGTTINDLTLGQIAATVGGEGGGIYSTNTGQIRGSMGGWSVDLTTAPYNAFTNTNNLGLKCDGFTTGAVSLSVGHSFMALWFTSGGNLSSTLYRDAVPGNPGLNTMNTPILMGAGSIQTSGSACTTNGALGRDSSGAILSCVSSVWTAPSGSSPYWGDPVATFAALPVCNAANSGQTRVVNTPTTGSGARAYTCNGAGTWQPLSLADNGSITIPGTASIDKLSGNLQITSTATENTACSPNGRIASDANGLILSCQSGVWKTAFGGYNGPTVVSFYTSGTWTVPPNISKAKITIFGAGGGGAGCRYYPTYGGNGGQGGSATVYLSGISGTYNIDIGSGGTPGYGASSVGQTGGTTSFSNLIYAFGGGGGLRQTNPRPADGATGGITVNAGQYIGSAQIYSPYSGQGGAGASCTSDGNPRNGNFGQNGSLIIEY